MNPSANQKHAHRSPRRTHERNQPAVSGYGPDDLSGVNPYAAGDLKRIESETAADQLQAEQLAEAIRRLAAQGIESETLPAGARSHRVDAADAKITPPSGAPRNRASSGHPDAYASEEQSLLELSSDSDAPSATAQTVELSLEALEALQQTVREVSLQNQQLGRQNSSLAQDVLRAREEMKRRGSGIETTRQSEKSVSDPAMPPGGSWIISTDTDSIDVGSVNLPPIALEGHLLKTQDWISASAVWFNDQRWEPEIVGYADAVTTANSPSPHSAEGKEADMGVPGAEVTPVVSHRWDPAVTKAVPDPRIQAGIYITATSDLERFNRQKTRKDDRQAEQKPEPQSPQLPRAADNSLLTASEAFANGDEVDVLIGASPELTEQEAQAKQANSRPEFATTHANEPMVTAPSSPEAKLQASSPPSPPLERPLVQAAWEVDYFRWPEVTHRLLRDEGQSLDTLLHSLHASQQNLDSPRIVLVTGTRPSEGRSTLAISLARHAAARGQRTLLVDGDLNRGQLEQAAGLEFPLGWKRREADDSIDECLVRSLASNLFVMPQGETPDERQTVSACYNRLWQFIARAAAGFDVIFVDAGIVEEFIDYSVPAPKLVDTALLVQGGVLGEGQSIVDAYRSLIHAGIKSIAVAETFGKRMAG